MFTLLWVFDALHGSSFCAKNACPALTGPAKPFLASSCPACRTTTNQGRPRHSWPHLPRLSFRCLTMPIRSVPACLNLPFLAQTRQACRTGPHPAPHCRTTPASPCPTSPIHTHPLPACLIPPRCAVPFQSRPCLTCLAMPHRTAHSHAKPVRAPLFNVKHPM